METPNDNKTPQIAAYTTTEESPAKTPGQIAYEAYIETHFHVPWDVLSPAQKRDWERVELAARAPLQAELNECRRLNLQVVNENLCLKKRIAELEKRGLQFETCDVCGNVAWTERVVNSNPVEVCLFCEQKAQISELSQKLEASEKAAAAMRKVIEKWYPTGVCSRCCDSNEMCSWCNEHGERLNTALSSDAGKDYIHKTELETVQKEAAAQRAIIQESITSITRAIYNYKENPVIPLNELRECRKMLIRVFELNAGKGYIPLSEVEPLLEAIELSLNIGNMGLHECEAALKTWNQKHGVEV